MANIKPTRDWLLVEPDKFEGPGGIVLLDSSKDPGGTNSGRIVDSGPGKVEADGWRWEMTVNVGEHILFMRKHGYLVKHEGKSYVMVKDENVMAVFDHE